MTFNVVSPSPTPQPVGTKYAKDDTPVQQVSFKANEKAQKSDEFVVKKVPATTGKKWGVGIASYFCPGLGQGINGQWGKAAGFFAGTLTLGGIMGVSIAKTAMTGKAKLGGIVAAGLAATALNIWSVVDAVKNARSEVLVPKK